MHLRLQLIQLLFQRLHTHPHPPTPIPNRASSVHCTPAAHSPRLRSLTWFSRRRRSSSSAGDSDGAVLVDRARLIPTPAPNGGDTRERGGDTTALAPPPPSAVMDGFTSSGAAIRQRACNAKARNAIRRIREALAQKYQPTRFWAPKRHNHMRSMAQKLIHGINQVIGTSKMEMRQSTRGKRICPTKDAIPAFVDAHIGLRQLPGRRGAHVAIFVRSDICAHLYA